MALIMVVGLATPSFAGGSELDGLIREARQADIVILGEIHDNPDHHRVQAEVVEAIDPPALVFEMVPQAREQDLNDLRSEGAGREQLADELSWDQSGWPDFSNYFQILEAAPGALVLGGGQSPAQMRNALRKGAASAFGPSAGTYGLDVPIDPDELASREEQMALSHCGALPDDALRAMLEVQRFRDASLADAAIRARERTGGTGPVVMIAGSGHADRRWGVPALVEVADPGLKVLAVGLQETGSPSEDSAFDLVIRSAPPDREDPCAAFSKQDS
jgi:uncharacterized iron-regulated protein